VLNWLLLLLLLLLLQVLQELTGLTLVDKLLQALYQYVDS
jgi:hypothetical protein